MPADCGVMPQRIGFSCGVGWLTSWTDCCERCGLPLESPLEIFPSPRSIGLDQRSRACSARCPCTQGGTAGDLTTHSMRVPG
jgi:hypothetical protein